MALRLATQTLLRIFTFRIRAGIGLEDGNDLIDGRSQLRGPTFVSSGQGSMIFRNEIFKFLRGQKVIDGSRYLSIPETIHALIDKGANVFNHSAN